MSAINVQPHRGPRAKGPEILSDEAISDIVYGRKLVDARKVLAKRFGVSEGRIDKIWHEYYGGTTLKDAKNGLKKQPPCPQREVPQVVPKNTVQVLSDGSKILKTARGTYTLRAPTKAAKDEPRAAEIVDKINKGEPELELEAVGTGAAADISDNDAAKIVAGQVLAGNNNPELLAVLDRLADLGENMSRTTELLVEQARRKAAADTIRPQKRKIGGKNIDRGYDLGQSGYDDAEEDSVAADSETDYDDESSYEESDDGGFYDVNNGVTPSRAAPSRSSSAFDIKSLQFRHEDSENLGDDDGLFEGTPKRPRGAEPVYSAVARRPVRAARQADTGPAGRSRQAVQPPQRDAGQRLVQQDFGNNSGKFSQGPGQRVQANSAGNRGSNPDQWRAGLKRPP